MLHQKNLMFIKLKMKLISIGKQNHNVNVQSIKRPMHILWSFYN